MATPTKSGSPEANRNNRPMNLGANGIGNGGAASRRRAMARAGGGSKMSSLPTRAAQPTFNTGQDYGDDSQRLVPMTGVPGSADGPPEGQTESEADLSPMARDVRDQEISAGRGNTGQQTQGLANPNPNISRGGLGVKDLQQKANVIRDGLGAGRQRLQDLEDKAHYYKDNAKEIGKDAAKDQIKKYIKNRLKQSTMLWVAGALSGLCGLTFALILFSTLLGPLQFIHVGRSLNYFHMSVQEAQTAYMALKLARNLPYVIDGQREKTRMGALGNFYANDVSNKMTRNGFSPKYESGRFTGWLVDPAKLSLTDHPGLKSQKPADAQKYFAERGWTAGADGDRILVQPSGRYRDYFKNFSMLSKIMRDVGVKRMVPLQAHFFKKRLGWTANPMKKWINDKDNKILSNAEKKLKFFKEQRAYARRGVQVSSPTATAKQTEDGKPGNQDGPNETREFLEERDKGIAALEEGDSSRINEFRNSINGKITGAGLGIISILCFLQALAHQWDVLVELNIVEPQERMGMQALSWGAANERGTSDVVAEDANAQMADLYYDKKTGTTVMDARSIQYENGQPQSGPDLPESAKPNPEGNQFTRFFAAVPGLDAVCSTTGQIVLFIAAIVVLGPINAAVSFAGAILAGPAIIMLTEYIMEQAMGNQVPGDIAGGLRGGHMDQGVFLASNLMGQNSGGMPLTEADSTLLKTASREANAEEFQQKSLAYRLFDAEDPRSLFAQVLDQQAPDPADNMSRIAMGLPNIARNFGSTLTRPFNSMAHAVDVPYNRGRPITATPFNVLTSDIPSVENPWWNADMVADILDANTASGATGADNYITRAKTCHGQTIAKVAPVVLPGAEPAPPAAPGAPAPAQMQYALMPPDNEVMPTDKTVRDPANKCSEDYGKPDANWPRVQLFIRSAFTWNLYVCGNYVNNNPIVKQACIDVGQEPNPNASGVPSGGVSAGSNCPSGKFPATITDAAGAKWKVTLPALSVPAPPGTNANGGAPEVKNPPYQTFCDPKYFAINDAGDGVVFTVFHGGSTTGGSKNPRSELRETFNGDPEGYWNAGSGVHTMEVSGYVTRLTKVKPHVVIAQVHDRGDDTSVWRVEGNNLWTTNGDNPHGCLVDANFQLNKPYTIKYVITNGNYEYFYNGAKVNCSYSNGNPSYFKAGNYLQSNPSSAPGESPTEYSQVVITRVTITHQ